MGAPPLPPGFQIEDRGDFDPLKGLLASGVEVTNGYRTKGDIERLKAEGYTPAEDSDHLRGDGVDLAPGKTGWNLARLQAAARKQFGPEASVEVHNGTHVHVSLKGWGGAPGTPGTRYSGLPDIPEGFELKQRGSLAGQNLTAGAPHDGDTFKLSNGQNGRLFGADAYELHQQGHEADGSTVPLGEMGREFMAGRVPGQPFNVTGGQSYGRPVGTVGTPDNDPANALIRNGLGLAAPEYLKGSPQFAPYMEAERLARLNLLGGHGTDAVTPSQFRHGQGPFAEAEQSPDGKGIAVFKDEPTPFQGLRPEIAKGYLSIWQDLNSKPDDLLAYAKQNGFTLYPAEVEKAYSARNKAKAAGDDISYVSAPAPLIDPGDGKTGPFLRGLADPLNMIDELGGLADTVGIPSPGAGGPRENIFNSDRRFGDILWNNIDQNRAVLGHDDMAHPIARTVGQVGSGLAIPAFGIEGVAAKATEEALAAGATRYAAEQAGKRAVAQRLAIIGGGEGGAMGFGAGEGGPVDRLPSAALGAAGGAVAAPLLGAAGNAAVEALGPLAKRAWLRRPLSDAADSVAPDAAPPMDGQPYIAPEMLQRVNGGASISREPNAVAAMAAEPDPTLVGPVMGGERHRDYINVGDLPPMPDGFRLESPFGTTRPINERLSADEMAKLAEGVDPRGAIPRPGNVVESMSEAEKANPSRFVELQAPNETDALPKLPVGQNSDLFAKPRTRRDIYDVTKMLRKWGGVQDQGGELSHLGISNAPRSNLPFGKNEQFIGKLVNDKGMTLDEAGERLWEAGYFKDRPTTSELLNVLHQEHLGNSHYHPEDLNAVDEFHGLQDQRHAIEQAQHEGVPLVDERGESINLDDLVANTPPADAYEEMPRLTGKVGNLNLSRLEKPQDVAALVNQVANRVGGFSAAARGKITHAETERLAQELGLKPEQLLKRLQGQALNAEQLYASRALVQRSRETVARMAKKAVGGSDEDLLAFRKAWLAHAALEEQVSGATAEAGRALSQMRALAKGSNADANAVRAYLKGSGGRDSIEDAARAIVDLMEDPAKANHFMREAVKPRWRDKFNELWINSLLSGPTTHAVNMVGNALTTAMSFPETAMAAGIGKVLRSPDRAYLREVGSRAVGMADAAIPALRAAKKAFLSGEASDEVTKVENAHHQAIGGKVGEIIRLPTKALTAADELWSGMLRGAELRQAAFRRAAGEGRDAEGIKKRFAALMADPPEDLLKQAEESARYYTFRKELGPTGKSVQQLSNNWIGGKLIIPFVRTPINILKFAGERSVLGLAMPEVRAALRSGGRARDEALAKITLGSGLSTAAVMGAMNGTISGGGPTDPRERAALLQSGWQPYSIRIGDKWVSYSRFDPVSTLFGVAADFAEVGKWATTKEADQVALNLAISIAKNITNKTWLSGLSDAFDVLSDPERYGKSYFQRLAGSAAVPSLLNQAAQATDPNLRDARTIMDAIKARVPVLSQSVPARLDVWGDPIKRGDAVGPDIVSPFYTTQQSNDPVKKEIARLRAPLPMPQRRVRFGGQDVQLTPQQYGDYVRLAGRPAKAWLDGYIHTPEWRAMNDVQRRDEVASGFEDFRAAARDELRKLYPELGSNAPRPPSGFAPSKRKALPPLPPGFVPLSSSNRNALSPN